MAIDYEKLKRIKEGLPYTLTDEQDDFIHKFIMGEGHWSLIGDGGSGKSLTMWILKLYYEDEILFVASTGTASQEMPNDIGSGTGHALFNIPRDIEIETDRRKRPSDILTKTSLIKIIVVEEGYCYNSQDLSFMLRQVAKVNKRSKNREQRDIRLLLVGDSLQRLPIVSDKKYMEHLFNTYGHYLMFRSTVWEEANFKTYVFQEVKRQVGTEPKDVWFRKALYVLRYGLEEHYDHIIKGFNKKVVGNNHSKDAVYLAPTNKKVNLYNEQYLARNPNEKYTFSVDFDKGYNKEDFPLDWEVDIAVGCKFINLVNSPEQGIYNGTVLTCTGGISSEGLFAETKDGEQVFIGIHEFKQEEVYAGEEDRNGILTQVQKRRHIASAWHLPIKLCAGFSYARSQGKSLEGEVVLDFGSDRDTWLYTKRGMEDFMVAGAFVGFSRVTNIDNVKLRNPLKREHIKVCRDSIDFWWQCVEGMKDL